MFKSLNTDWLKLALLKVCQSGWTIIVLVGLSLLFCNFYGRQAFLVWWLAMSGIVLIGFSIALGNLPYRLIEPTMNISRYSYFWSWVVWGCGFALLIGSSLFADRLILLLIAPVGALTGVTLCLWVSRKGLLKWIH